MDTHFASAQRSDDAQVAKQSEAVLRHPVTGGLLQLVSGMLAVLNENRQIIALNHEVAQRYGIEDPEGVLGLRPGECLSCVHADDMPGGCGTGPLCDSCGAAIAIVTTLTKNEPAHRRCAIEIRRNNERSDLYLDVHCIPVMVDGYRYLLLFIQDVSGEQKWAVMERAFFHDVNNILAGVVSISNMMLLQSEGEYHELAEKLSRGSQRIAREMAIQRCLLDSTGHQYRPVWNTVDAREVVEELVALFDNHPAAHGKNLVVPVDMPSIVFETDRSVLLRILDNMVVNAFEASGDAADVIISYDNRDDEISFSVWNEGQIPAEVAGRVFQRNISTKTGKGRGLGTYSMKYFGETILGGKVRFSSDGAGTVFTYTVDKQRAFTLSDGTRTTSTGDYL